MVTLYVLPVIYPAVHGGQPAGVNEHYIKHTQSREPDLAGA